jgi:hypothetical protein
VRFFHMQDKFLYPMWNPDVHDCHVTQNGFSQ